MRRVAIVTGATSGIGRACVDLFAERGWAVVGVARRREALERLAGALGDSYAPVVGDAADPATSRAAVAAALHRFGRLDAAVANAAITLAKTAGETTAAELDRMLAVNVKGPFHLAQAVHGALVRTRGSLVVMASNKGLVGQRGSPAYVATKGAAVQLARALALDWAGDGIRVNAVCPGLVDTPMLRSFAAAQPDAEAAWARLEREQPLGRLARPEECAEAVLWLASPASSFVAGIALPVDGGFTAQ